MSCGSSASFEAVFESFDRSLAMVAEQDEKVFQYFFKNFENAYEGILNLPNKARFGVYVAYKYYLSLFKKIKRTTPADILEQRIRIPSYGKAYIVAKAGLRSQFNLY